MCEQNKVASLFLLEGNVTNIEPYGCGHINTTFLVTTDCGNKYILQKINNQVFNDINGLQNNIYGVTDYLLNTFKDDPQKYRKTLTLVKTKDGKLYLEQNNKFWRVFKFIESTVTYQQIEKPEDFYFCGEAFGLFQEQLALYPADKLIESIKDFHNTEKRYQDFINAVNTNPYDRVKDVLKEVEFCKNHKYLASAITSKIKSGKIPLRVTHNDTKLNNILFDSKTNKPICVIDLDTVMPGAACYDFGDSIRFGASTGAEDEKDLTKIELDLTLFEAFTKGYLKSAGKFLSREEKSSLSFGAMVMTYECGMRFLTDYILGDTYFATHYEKQNIFRTRTQFKLVADMESKKEQMDKIVNMY